jgi:peptidoglycan/LPS O-acetylase OafA/YrhL
MRHLPALDGIRFFAFLLVFIHHAHVADVPILGWIKRLGWVGVELFFVLSAFLLFRNLAGEFSKRGTIDTGQFFSRRFLRIYPAMFLFATGALLLALASGTADSVWSRYLGVVTLTDNIATAFLGYNTVLPWSAHLWTLGFEFQYYLAIPALFLLSRQSPRLFAVIAVSISVAGLVLRIWAVSVGAKHPFIWVLPFLRPDSILVGMALALAYERRRPPPTSVLVAVVAVSAIVLSLSPPIGTGSVDTYLYPAMALLFGSLVWLVLSNPLLQKLLQFPAVAYLGQISFGLYVYHLAAIAVASRLAPPELETPLALCLTVAVAVASYHLLEKPILRLHRPRVDLKKAA